MTLASLIVLVLSLIAVAFVLLRLRRLERKVLYKPQEVGVHLACLERRMVRPYNGLDEDPDGDHWVCLCTRDRRDMVSATIASIRRHEPGAKLLVIDNGSTDDTPARLQALKADAVIDRLLLNAPETVPQWQKCFSIHQAMGLLACERVASITWMDDDIEIKNAWIETAGQLLDAYDDVRLINLMADPREDRHHPIVDREEFQGETVLLKQTFGGQCFFVRPEFFRELGLPPIREGIQDASVEDWYYSRLLTADDDRVAVLDRAATHGYGRSLRIEVQSARPAGAD